MSVQRGSRSQRFPMRLVQKAGAFPMHKGPVTWAMALPQPSPQPTTRNPDGVWSRGRSLTFILLNAGRPGRKARTGSFCKLWETTHASVGKARKGRSLIFSLQGNTGFV